MKAGWTSDAYGIVCYLLGFVIRDEHSGNQRVGGFDRLSHVLRFPKLLHILSGVIREAGIARRVPGIELDAFRSFKVFDCEGMGEPQHV